MPTSQKQALVSSSWLLYEKFSLLNSDLTGFIALFFMMALEHLLYISELSLGTFWNLGWLSIGKDQLKRKQNMIQSPCKASSPTSSPKLISPNSACLRRTSVLCCVFTSTWEKWPEYTIKENSSILTQFTFGLGWRGVYLLQNNALEQ